MISTSMTFVNMPESFWSLLCCVGVILLSLFLATVKWGEQAEDLSFYQALPIAALWSFLGLFLILFNKFMFLPDGAGFGFPFAVFVVWMHACTGTIFAIILRLARPDMMPFLSEGKLTFKIYCINVLPIAAMQAAALAVGNLAYLHISVAYIQ